MLNKSSRKGTNVPQVSQARLREDEEEEVRPRAGQSSAAAAAAAAQRGGRPGTGAGSGPGRGVVGGEEGGTDGFTVTDAPQEMDANMEYKELALEGDRGTVVSGENLLKLSS